MSSPLDTNKLELTEIQFEEFEKLLKDNPISENEALKKLLTRETAWANKTTEVVDNT